MSRYSGLVRTIRRWNEQMNVFDQLQQYGDVLCNEPLKKHTTFRIGGECDYFVYPKNILCFLRIQQILKEKAIPYQIFGKGSNLLCSDDAFHGVVICLDRYFNNFYFEEDGTLLAEAGCSIILLAQEAMRRSFTGLEFASGIPGTLGGALYMNAGAYKSEMASFVQQVLVYREGRLEWIDKLELDYSYRHSIFQSKPMWCILGAKLKLTKGDQKEIRTLMDSRRARRLASQPLDKPNCGSVFRNPQDNQAWQLIESIGYRGKVIGGAMVSDKHANFIVNVGDAKANDVYQLIQEIQDKVKERYGIEMITEVERFNWKE